MKTMIFSQRLVNLQGELFQNAYKLTSNYEDANDLVQETSLKVLDHENMFVQETNFKGWVCTIMRNLFINHYRRDIREQTFVDKTTDTYFINQSRDSAGFESTESNYDMKEIRRIVNSLPLEYKVPFSMFVSGFKYREIAEKLNLPLGTVKSRIFFTRQRLQGQLRDFRN